MSVQNSAGSVHKISKKINKGEEVKDMNKLLVSSSPHIGSSMTTDKIMKHVVIALLPACIAGIFIFGLTSLVILIVSTGTCVLAEFLYNKLMKKPQTVGDFSAVVTGLLLGMNLPPTIPLYIPIIGGVFAILVVKMLFGGLGKNFANPAITARIFVVLAWTGAMTTYVQPVDYSQGFLSAMTNYFPQMFGTVDAVTSATPLGVVKSSLEGGSGSISIMNMFLGYTGGCIGEVSALALILGGIYLIIKRNRYKLISAGFGRIEECGKGKDSPRVRSTIFCRGLSLSAKEEGHFSSRPLLPAEKCEEGKGTVLTPRALLPCRGLSHVSQGKVTLLICRALLLC